MGTYEMLQEIEFNRQFLQGLSHGHREPDLLSALDMWDVAYKEQVGSYPEFSRLSSPHPN